MKQATNLILISLISVLSLPAQENPFVRFPSINHSGTQIAFAYQGDIWTVPISGGQAVRLTIHEAYESRPAWSFQDDKIVFQGNRYGNNDLFVMGSDGSEIRRLTHHSTQDDEASFTPDGQILFSTRRAFVQLEREDEIHQIATTGGTPVRFLDELGSTAVMSPNGEMVAFTRGSCRITREAYRGPAQRDIWIYHIPSKSYQQITNFDGQDIYPRWGDDQTLYYLSAQNGKYNLFRCQINPDGGKVEGSETTITKMRSEGIRYYDVCHSKGIGVVEMKNGIQTISLQNGKLSPLPIKVPADDRFDSYLNESFSSGVNDYAVSPNGKWMAIEIRGDLFVKEVDKDNKRSVQVTDHPFHDREAIWMNDTTLLFLSDRSGNYDLYQVTSSDPAESNLFKSLKHEVKRVFQTSEEESAMWLAPDGSGLAVLQGRGKLILYPIDTLGQFGNPSTLLDGWASPAGISWSPDSRFLAYSLEDLNFNEEIYIHPIDGSMDPINVSMHPRGDYSPEWSPDGSKLAFLSIRNNGDSDVWFAWLKESDWEKTSSDWEEDDDEEKKDKKESAGVDSILIDFESIHERLVQVTRMAGNEGNLAVSKDGETFYFSNNGGGRQGGGGDPEYMKIKWDGSDMESVLSNGRIRNVKPDPAHEYLMYQTFNGGLSRLKMSGGKPEGLPFQAKMKIDLVQEKRQVFDEGWKVLNEGFYDPNFHGQDWSGLKEKYRPWALQASTKQDFMDMFNEMLGQVNASHMGMFGSTPEETQRERTGYLGVEVQPTANGMKVTKVIPGTPADRSSSQLATGDLIRSVNGKSLSANSNLFELLNEKADEKILLTVRNTQGEDREVVIRPSNSVNREKYESWIKWQKELTDKYSGGKLGYIHIQGMNWPSFERFERELMASGHGKEGIVIDVRYNGGGWTTDMLMAVLTVRQHAYTVPRGASDNLEKEHKQFSNYYPFGERLPLASWTKPSVALCNANSYSNAEIFSHAYKHLGIGTLVGQPTFGAVISTGGARLMDGSFVRLPFRGWYVKATEENMEHGPAVPDIEILNPPGLKAEGEDFQLKRAVDVLLGELQSSGG